MERKSFEINLDEIKKDDAGAGTFTGYANVTEFKDSGGDIIHQGAFARTLNKRSTLPLLALHDISLTVGAVNLEEDAKGLKVTKGELNLAKAAAQDIYADMMFYKERKLPMEMSIGFRLVDKKWDFDDKTGTRHIREVNLKEVSLVPPGFAMNSRSRVTTVKSEEQDVFKRMLELESKLRDVTTSVSDISNKTLLEEVEKLKNDVTMLLSGHESLASRLELMQSSDSLDRHSEDVPEKVTDGDPVSPEQVALELRAQLETILGAINEH